jgi:SsrA-binding protein
MTIVHGSKPIVNVALEAVYAGYFGERHDMLAQMKVVAENRRARFDYEILETAEAGIVLTGQEVKSCRLGQVNLSGSYVSFFKGVPRIKHMKISPYKYAGSLPGYDPERDRELLLKKAELEKMERAADEKGMTIIPLQVRAGRFIKVLLGLGLGRKKIDKRQKIKEREIERKIRKELDY